MTAETKQRVIIFGAGGFLGSNLTRRLAMNSEVSVVAVTSRNPESLKKKIIQLESRSMSSVNDLAVISNEEVLSASFFEKDDVVINCAFPWNRGGFEMAKGLDFHYEVFSKAAAANVRRLINISSQSVYAQDRSNAASEIDDLELDTPYAVAKYSMELLATAFLGAEKVVSVRMASLIGPGYNVRILNRFIQQAISGKSIRVFNPDQMFSYLDVRDACRGIELISLAPSGKNLPTVLNIGTRAKVSLAQLAEAAVEAVSKITDKESVSISYECDDDGKLNSRFSLDCSQAEKHLKYTAKIPLSESALWIASSFFDEVN